MLIKKQNKIALFDNREYTLSKLEKEVENNLYKLFKTLLTPKNVIFQKNKDNVNVKNPLDFIISPSVF